MFNIYIIDRITKNQYIIETVETEEQAESFCDSWGWIYSDEKGVSYWLDYENKNNIDCNITFDSMGYTE